MALISLFKTNFLLEILNSLKNKIIILYNKILIVYNNFDKLYENMKLTVKYYTDSFVKNSNSFNLIWSSRNLMSLGNKMLE
jgi:hypothetical protein